jgi:DNA-binding transcriptional LysR family regulator
MDPHKLGLVATRLQYFQTVARLGSIRRAAVQLNVAPSSISRMITQLEEEIGAALFERVARSLKLTSAGELLVYHARASVTELAKACAEIDDMRGLRRGSVSVASVESVAHGLLPDVLSAFWTRHPEVTVDVQATGSRRALEAVQEGECDLAVVFDLPVPRVGQRLARVHVQLGALVAPDHPFAGREQLKMSDFADQRVFLSDASLSLGPSIEEALINSAVHVRRRVTTNSMGLMADLAARGHGIAFQTRVGVERHLRDGSLVFVPVQDTRLKPRPLMLFARSKAHLSAASQALAKLIAQALEGLETTPKVLPSAQSSDRKSSTFQNTSNL